MQANGNTLTFSVTQAGQFYENIAWNFGEGSTANGQTATHTYSNTGNFTVCVVGYPMPIAQPDTMCKPVSIVITGIQKNKSLEGVKLFPNPTKDFVTLSLANENKDTRLLLINSLGKVVLVQEASDATNTIDLRNYPTGLYLLKVQNGSESRVFKLIKE